MMLGQAAGDAAHLAVTGKTTVQKVDVRELRKLLSKEGAILDAGYQPAVKIAWSPSYPQPGEPVSFRALTGELKAPLAKCWWDFEGTGQVSASEMKSGHSFALEKIYNVSLLVEDAAGRRRLVGAEVPVGRAIGRDITLDDFEADLFGAWNGTHPDLIRKAGERLPDVFYGPGIHRDVVRKGKVSAARARFQPTFAKEGRYLVCLGFRAARDQATNTPLTIRHAAGTKKLTVDQRKETTPFNLVPLGEFRFRAGDAGFVEVTNGGTDGRIAIDAVRWVWLGE